jgi:hypothetical protein
MPVFRNIFDKSRTAKKELPIVGVSNAAGAPSFVLFAKAGVGNAMGGV